MPPLAFIGWLLGIAGIYTRPAAFAILIVCAASLAREAFLYRRELSATSGDFRLRPEWPVDVAFIITFIPVIAWCAITPFLDGDAFYSWNTWARHWGSRADMSGYYFHWGFGQLAPIVSSYIYKLFGSGTDTIPLQQYVLHGFHGILWFLSTMVLIRTVSLVRGGISGALAGGLGAFLLMVEYELYAHLPAGRTEGFMFFFASVALYEFVTLSKKESAATRDFLRFGLILAGMSFMKAPSTIVAMMLAALLPILQVDRAAVFADPFKKTLRFLFSRWAVIGVFPIIVAGPFVTQQMDYWGHTGYTNPTNHSLNPTRRHFAGSAGALTFKAYNSRMKGSGSKNGASLFFYDIREAMLPNALRNKPWSNPVPMSRRVVVFAVSVLLLMGAFSSRTGFAFMLVGAVYFVLWWMKMSYARYNLTVIMPVFGLLVAFGAAKAADIIEKAARKDKGALDGSIVFKTIGTIALVVPLCVFAIYPWIRTVYYDITSFGFFLAQDWPERLERQWPNAVDATYVAKAMHEKEFDPSDPEKYLVAADLPMYRLIPNTVYLGHIHTPPQSPLYMPWLVKKGREGAFTQVSKKRIDGGFPVRSAYIRPAARLFRPMGTFDGAPAIVNWPAASERMLLKISSASCDTPDISESISPAMGSGPSWLVSGEEQEGWNGTSFAPSKKKWFISYQLSHPGVPGEGSFALIPSSAGIWIGRNPAVKDASPIYFRKKIHLITGEATGVITISGDDSYRLYHNGRLVGQTANNWVNPEQYKILFHDGDVLGVEVSDTGNQEALFVDIRWNRVPMLEYAGSDRRGRCEVDYFAIKNLTQDEMAAAKSAGRLPLPKLGEFTRQGFSLSYYPIPRGYYDR